MSFILSAAGWEALRATDSPDGIVKAATGREQALAPGCAGDIEKPIDPPSLALPIEEHLRPAGRSGDVP